MGYYRYYYISRRNENHRESTMITDSREDEYASGASEAMYDEWMDRQDQEDLDHGLPEHLRDYNLYTWEL